MLMKIEILTVSSDKKGMRKEYTTCLTKTLYLFFEIAFVKMKGGTYFSLTGNRKLHYLKNGCKKQIN